MLMKAAYSAVVYYHEKNIWSFIKVKLPKIEILGESDMYVKSGSTVSLKCVITQSLEEPAYIFWYHDNERVLDYDRRYKDIRVERVGSDTTVGSLILHQATKEDSGNYTCSPSNLDSSSILLHVLNGLSHLPPCLRDSLTFSGTISTHNLPILQFCRYEFA
ncbi:hypothetical protein RUM44_006016 [Polyplax serrata]|uniref:Ig-like domain-containing protein n=1 Tax=Polyplax serrata TaxID=468196 RepID=A0ABR1AYR9_POLSC